MTARSERAALRREMRGRRHRLDRYARVAAERGFVRWLVRQPSFRKARRIGVYLANDGELDVALLVRRAWSMGKACYLPVLRDRPDVTLHYAPYRPDTRMLPNRFGIGEPDVPRRLLLSVRNLDLLLMPLVAFDAQGNRLGMGGGYFDRTLAYHRRHTHWRRPRLLGVAFAFQQVASLSCEPWDVPLDGVVTERGVNPNLEGRELS